MIESVQAQTPPAFAISTAEQTTIDEIRSTLDELPFLQATKVHLVNDFEDVVRAYHSGAHKACVVMCGAVMEGLLLGNLERVRSIRRLWGAGRLTSFTDYNGVRDSLRRASLEDLINHTHAANCVDGFTDEIARVVQRCRNSIHPGRVLRGDEVFNVFDKNIADIALRFLRLLASRIASS